MSERQTIAGNPITKLKLDDGKLVYYISNAGGIQIENTFTGSTVNAPSTKFLQDVKEDLESNINTVSTTVEEHGTKIEQNTNNISTLTSGLEETNTTVEGHTAEISEMQSTLSTLANTIYNNMYPIGYVAMFRDNTDRSNWLGFTWQKCLNGRFPVGQNSDDNEFSTVGATGGEKAHALTPDEAPTLNTNSKAIGIDGGTQHVTGYNTNGSAHNNLPPYEVVSYWVRTA